MGRHTLRVLVRVCNSCQWVLPIVLWNRHNTVPRRIPLVPADLFSRLHSLNLSPSLQFAQPIFFCQWAQSLLIHLLSVNVCSFRLPDALLDVLWVGATRLSAGLEMLFLPLLSKGLALPFQYPQFLLVFLPSLVLRNCIIVEIVSLPVLSQRIWLG